MGAVHWAVLSLLVRLSSVERTRVGRELRSPNSGFSRTLNCSATKHCPKMFTPDRRLPLLALGLATVSLLGSPLACGRLGYDALDLRVTPLSPADAGVKDSGVPVDAAPPAVASEDAASDAAPPSEPPSIPARDAAASDACAPRACTSAICGTLPDGCGDELDCGSCDPGNTCAPDGVCVWDECSGAQAGALSCHGFELGIGEYKPG
jgi:hypothetical protein